jgi:dihydrolipoamide dehydrogenase
MDTLMPTFDPEIRRVADRVLVQPRKIDGYTSVFATEVCFCLPTCACVCTF